MKAIVVLVMHGAPPNDFPEQDMNEFFALQNRLKRAMGAEREALKHRYLELDDKLRRWPRTAQNDPFHSGSEELAAHLRTASGCEVILGFNEFCAPSLNDALDLAIARKAQKIIVITPMMTRGGEHSEVDIPAAVQAAQAKHAETQILYVWPFEISDVANFLAAHIVSLI